VAGKTALNAKSLEALGPARLAELLIEISAGNAAEKRRLRLELAAAQSPGEVAKEVRKRLMSTARARSFVDWQGVRSLADDLDTQRRAIVERVAKAEPSEALDLLWRLPVRCISSAISPFLGVSTCLAPYLRVSAWPLGGGCAGPTARRPARPAPGRNCAHRTKSCDDEGSVKVGGAAHARKHDDPDQRPGNTSRGKPR